MKASKRPLFQETLELAIRGSNEQATAIKLLGRAELNPGEREKVVAALIEVAQTNHQGATAVALCDTMLKLEAGPEIKEACLKAKNPSFEKRMLDNLLTNMGFMAPSAPCCRTG